MGARQHASPAGSGNVVVQIIGEANTVTLGGAAALRLRAYDGAAFAAASTDPARAGTPGYAP